MESLRKHNVITISVFVFLGFTLWSFLFFSQIKIGKPNNEPSNRNEVMMNVIPQIISKNNNITDKMNQTDVVHNSQNHSNQTTIINNTSVIEKNRGFDIDKSMIHLKGFGQIPELKIPVCLYHNRDVISDIVKKTNNWENQIQLQMFNNAPNKEKCLKCFAIGSQCDCGLFVDIGANIGIHTIAMAALGFRVIAVEPNPNNIAILNCTLSMNPGLINRVTVINALLSNEEGIPCDLASHSQVNIGDTNAICGNTSEHRALIFEQTRSKGPGRLEYIIKGLMSDTLDHLMIKLREHNSNHHNQSVERFPEIIDAFKIDVERHEPQVLSGAKKLFNQTNIHSLSFECIDNWQSFWLPFLNEHGFVDHKRKPFINQKSCPKHDMFALKGSSR